MYLEYIYWQFVSGPRWLLRLMWNLQRLLVQFYSVPLMLRTLVSHWHKDRVSYRAGSIGGIIQALAWNAISRAIGAVVRTTVVLAWAASAAALVAASAVVWVLFVLWPLLVLVLLAAGIALVALPLGYDVHV